MLRLERLRAGYRERPVLRGVDLSVAAGELVVVIGPNGCGKTTLLRVIAGALRPAGGRVLVDGQDARAMTPTVRGRIVAVVAQGGTLPAGFTAAETVLMGRTPHLRLFQAEGARDRESARRAMEDAGCLDLAGRRVDALSGGERQRVVIARALAQEPRLLLLDEPTSHLDLGHQASVLRLLRRLCREQQLAVLAVVHDLALAAQAADRLVLMDGGRVLAEGDPAEVLTAERVASVYHATVSVLPHPQSGRPLVVARLDGDAPSPENGK